jgi:predicted dehydrogenase
MKTVEMYEKGDIGEIISIHTATYVRPNNYMVNDDEHWCHRLPGGIFFETIPHPVYLLQEFLTDAKPVQVLTKKMTDKPWLKAEDAIVMLESPDGMGLITASHNSPYHGDTMELFGSKLGVKTDLWGRSIIKQDMKTEEPVSVGMSNLKMAAQSVGILGATAGAVLKMATSGVGISAHHGFLEAYVDSILNDKPIPVSRETARENVRIVDDICKLLEENWR